VDSLEKELGDAWTAKAAEVWAAAYSALSSLMIEQAYGYPHAAESLMTPCGALS
jgi:hemoglobin-like flavoprotein